MKGREAVRAARRRESDAHVALEQLCAELKNERDGRRQEVNELRAEIRRLTADRLTLAGDMAKQEVSKRLAQVEEERRAKGITEDVVRHLALRKDRLMMNACRYISMTTGTTPDAALSVVLTWALDKDIDRIFRIKTNTEFFFIELGVPLDGWVARTFSHEQRFGKSMEHFVNWASQFDEAERRYGTAVSLDHAEEQGHSDIHKDYNPKWYPKIKYGGIMVVGKTKDIEAGNEASAQE